MSKEKKEKKKGGKLKIILIVFAIIIVLGAITSGGDEKKNTISDVSTETDSNIDTPNNEAEVSEPETTPEPEDNIPTEYKSALNRAESYSELMHMSKAAIYDQLISE